MPETNFSLQMPIHPNPFNNIILLTQRFGDNKMDYSKLGMIGHNGLDFKTTWCDKGWADILAAHDGYVISDSTVQKETSGIFVKLLSDEVTISGMKCKVMTLYFHLKTARVSITDPVFSEWFSYRKGERFIKAGQKIGVADNSGSFTSGPHLHFGMYIMWKQPNGLYTCNKSNGYDGASDPMPYFKDGKVYQIPTTWFSSDWYYNGEKVTRAQVNAILKKIN